MINNIIKKDDRVLGKISELIYKPIVIIVNKFNEEAVAKFANEFSAALTIGQPVIPIVIDSYGGEVYSLLSMIDIIKSSPIPVATISTGKSMSCGAVLLSCGSEGKRYISSNSTLMIHDVSSSSRGKVSEIKEDAKETERLNSLIYKLMARNVGKHDEYFMKLVHDNSHADWFLTPEDCVNHNLANHIRLPSFTTKINVEMIFE